MPIEILGRRYLTEAEFAEQLGCSALTLQRMRKAGRIGYQKLPGRRGAFYSDQHVDECFAALSMPVQSVRPPDALPINDAAPPPNTSRSTPPGQVGLSDIQLASEILSRRTRSRV